MITFLKGDLMADDADALVNTVNTVGVMGKGIALSFKKAFPANFAIYQAVCKAGQFPTGQLLPVRDKNLLLGERIILNFPTKTDWRKPSEYSYIASGLVALRKLITDLGLKTLAMPAPGCGNGGLDWSKVKPMIAEALDGLDCDIRVYEPGG